MAETNDRSTYNVHYATCRRVSTRAIFVVMPSSLYLSARRSEMYVMTPIGYDRNASCVYGRGLDVGNELEQQNGGSWPHGPDKLRTYEIPEVRVTRM